MLMNFNKYTLSKHFKDRVTTRFAIQSKSLNEWTKNLLNGAEFNRQVGNGTKAYRNGFIEFIVDEKSFVLITVYQINSHEDISDMKTNWNPEITTVIRKEMNRLRYKTIRKTAKKVLKYVQDNAELYEKINNSRNNRFLEQWFAEIESNRISMNKVIDRQSELLGQIELKKA